MELEYDWLYSPNIDSQQDVAIAKTAVNVCYDSDEELLKSMQERIKKKRAFVESLENFQTELDNLDMTIKKFKK